MHRVFFDSNAGGNDHYYLWFDASKRDLAAIGDELTGGLRVVIYMPGELEAEAELKWDDEHQCWVAVLVAPHRDLGAAAGEPGTGRP